MQKHRASLGPSLVVVADEDVGGIGHPEDAANEQVEQRPVAVADAVDPGSEGRLIRAPGLPELLQGPVEHLPATMAQSNDQ